MKFECPYCHAMYNGKLRFCPTCGNKMHYEVNDREAYRNSSDSEFNQTFMKDPWQTGAGCGCLFLLIFLAILWFMS